MSKASSLESTARRVVSLCQGYYWFLAGGIRLRNLPNPSIVYPHEYRFDCPIVFAVNSMREQAGKALLMPSDWLHATELLGLDYNDGFDLMLHVEWDGHTEHPKGEPRHFKLWSLRFQPEVRKTLLGLLV
jgi:hypothetical protein